MYMYVFSSLVNKERENNHSSNNSYVTKHTEEDREVCVCDSEMKVCVGSLRGPHDGEVVSLSRLPMFESWGPLASN